MNVRFLTGQLFSYKNSFLFGFVGKHCTTHHVPDGVDIGFAGLQLIIYFHLAPVIGLHPCILQAQPLCIRLPTDGNQAIIGIKLHRFTFLILGFNNDLLAFIFDGSHLMADFEINPEFFRCFHQFLAHGAVHGGNYPVHVFDHRDFGADACVYAAQLHSDNPSTYNHQVFRNFLELEGFCT